MKHFRSVVMVPWWLEIISTKPLNLVSYKYIYIYLKSSQFKSIFIGSGSLHGTITAPKHVVQNHAAWPKRQNNHEELWGAGVMDQPCQKVVTELIVSLFGGCSIVLMV